MKKKNRLKKLNYTNSKMTDIVYILFTSGSTGMPKGVEISNINLSNYLYELKSRYNFSSRDKFSNNFDVTFDLFAKIQIFFFSWYSRKNETLSIKDPR